MELGAVRQGCQVAILPGMLTIADLETGAMVFVSNGTGADTSLLVKLRAGEKYAKVHRHQDRR